VLQLCIYNFLEKIMKYLIVLVGALVLTACGTVGGAVSGAGKDLGKAGEWIQSK
jgi:predicted small secreted protein